MSFERMHQLGALFRSMPASRSIAEVEEAGELLATAVALRCVAAEVVAAFEALGNAKGIAPNLQAVGRCERAMAALNANLEAHP
jgi:hypothetical protein